MSTVSVPPTTSLFHSSPVLLNPSHPFPQHFQLCFLCPPSAHPLRKCSSCMALSSLIKSLLLFRAMLLCLVPFFLLATFHNPFLCHETSNFNFPPQPLALLLCHSFFFSPSTVHPFAFLSGTYPSPSSFVPSTSVLLQFISSGPRRHHAYPEHFLHHADASPFGSNLLTMPYTPNALFLIFSTCDLSPSPATLELQISLASPSHLMQR